MYILGINAAFHDSAACLVKDGIVIAAAEEERFTGIKHGKRPIPFSAYELPYHAIDFCLKEAGIHLNNVDHIAYSFNPDIFPTVQSDKTHIELPLKPHEMEKKNGESPWDPLFLLSIMQAPEHLADGFPHHLQERLFMNGHKKSFQWHFVDHHLAHATSAFYPSPFQEAAILTLDGRGEQATTSYYVGKGYELSLLKQVTMPHSLGMLYERITSHLGFLHSSDEYKVMALASYGKPKFIHVFRDMIQVNGGDYTIKDIDLEKLFGPKRLKGSEFTQHHFDIAHSLQIVLEETVLKLLTWFYETTKLDYLCLAGGVALNCVMNARLRDRGPFKKIWIQPAAGDAGTALGAALWVDAQERAAFFHQERSYTMEHAYLGPRFTDGEVEDFLRWSKTPYRRLNNVAEETVDLLLENKVIGWFQGKMEFGPRALGGRSIIASPIRAEMQSRLNEIKDREDFRPVAPVVLEEEAKNWFINGDISPFMLFIYDVNPKMAPQIPAVCHVDGTARIQTIRKNQHPRYYELLKSFQSRTGIPILINTSFNTRGKPIVCTIRDAIECFWSSPLDALVIESFLIEKGKT
jgi:carbamoyltransferase